MEDKKIVKKIVEAPVVKIDKDKLVQEFINAVKADAFGDMWKIKQGAIALEKALK